MEASTDVDGHIGVWPITYAIIGALTVPAKPECSVKNFRSGKFASILGFVPPSLLGLDQLVCIGS